MQHTFRWRQLLVRYFNFQLEKKTSILRFFFIISLMNRIGKCYKIKIKKKQIILEWKKKFVCVFPVSTCNKTLQLNDRLLPLVILYYKCIEPFKWIWLHENAQIRSYCLISIWLHNEHFLFHLLIPVDCMCVCALY